MLSSLKQSRFDNNEQRYRDDLKRAQLTEDDLKAAFLWQLTVLRFIEYRFRPGIQISDEEIRDHYNKKFVPQWKASSADPPPTFEDASETCEENLVQERIDNLLDRWISLSRTQTNIRYRDDVFKASTP